MKVTVTGSLGNISRILTEKLVSSGHEVKVITSTAERVAAIESLQATALVGSIEDEQFLAQAFANSDAVYLMIPPSFTTTDVKHYIKSVGDKYVNAIKKSGVKYVVNLSSIGADAANGLGPTGANFYVEQKLNELKEVHVLHLRPGMFLTNFYGAIPMIKYQNILGNNFNGEIKLPLTHPKDIATAAFNALDSLSISGKQVQYVISDEKNGQEIANILGKAVDKAIQWIEFSDEQLLGALTQNGFSQQMAEVYMVEIGIALRDGSFTQGLQKQKIVPVKGTSLQDFAAEFSMAYQYQ